MIPRSGLSLVLFLGIGGGSAAAQPQPLPPKPGPKQPLPPLFEYQRRQMILEHGRLIRGILEHNIAQGDEVVAILERHGGM